jgi:hypothetical protein
LPRRALRCASSKFSNETKAGHRLPMRWGMVQTRYENGRGWRSPNIIGLLVTHGLFWFARPVRIGRVRASGRLSGLPWRNWTPIDALSRSVNREILNMEVMNDGTATTTRNPMLLFRLSGALLLRLADRQFAASLFHEPPRTTRAAPSRPAPATFAGFSLPTQVVLGPEPAACLRQPPIIRPISSARPA